MRSRGIPWGQFHRKCMRYLSLIWVWKFTNYLRLQPRLAGANELNISWPKNEISWPDLFHVSTTSPGSGSYVLPFPWDPNLWTDCYTVWDLRTRGVMCSNTAPGCRPCQHGGDTMVTVWRISALDCPRYFTVPLIHTTVTVWRISTLDWLSYFRIPLIHSIECVVILLISAEQFIWK